jgi:undecaprenyl-diphosphatase
MYNNSGGLGKAISTVLDVTVDNNVAPVLFGLLVPIVWLAWGRYAVVTYFLVGALTAPISLMELAHRPRPMDDLTFSDVVLGKGGYPSGHTLYAVLVFGIIAYLAARYGAPSKWRTALVWAILVVVVLMGPSRVVNVSHWPADVIASYLIGLALILSTIWLHERTLPWLDRHIPFAYSLLTGDGRAGR